MSDVSAQDQRRASYALFATFWLNDVVVDEVSVAYGEELKAGRDGQIRLPVPPHAPFVARATWQRHDLVLVEDGQGERHVLGPDGTLQIRLGPVMVECSLARQFAFRRSEPLQLMGSLAFFTVFFAVSLLGAQVETVVRNLCPWFGIACPVEVSVAGVDGVNAEYLARLLREDYAGEEVGYIVQDTPEVGQDIQGFMPAGDLGPVTEFGGAAETAPEPVRGPAPEEILPRPAPKAVDPPLTAPEEVGTPIVEPESDPANPGISVSDDGLDADADELTEEQPDELPAEEEEGWGIRDWLDASPEEREEMEIEVMIKMSEERLRIDPDDPDALGLLAYYQYLQEDLDAAERTFDRLIELYPDEAAGYNNKALVYKRRGEYAKEEALYRVALALDPGDATAMNNLAVSLSHQGRHEEAMAYMEQVGLLTPDEPYSDLHRAKIYAQMGDEENALIYLRKALQGMAALDTLHHIEFRQDIRVDPSFTKLRQDPRFRAILQEFYGSDSPLSE